MTEEEAKTKWCPFANVGSTTSGLGGFNRFIPPVGSGSEDSVRCIGSACMMWRESEVYDTRAKELWSKKKGERVNSAYGSDAEWRLVNPDEPLPPAQGWCGLAGKP